MSRSTAISEAQRLKRIIESYGLRCTIELQQGRPHSNRWYTRKHVLMSHHTAGPSSGNTPSLSVCKYGRSGLPGPLCNAYMGRDKVFRIICMGLANHPGAGGPLTRDGVTLPRNSARIASFGIEYEHNGVSSWPSGMRDAMARANAAVLDWMGRPTTSAIEHSTWTTRKIDRSPGYSRSGSTGQSEIAAVRGTAGEDWLDMDESRLRTILREEHKREREPLAKQAAHKLLMWMLKHPNGKTYPIWQYFTGISKDAKDAAVNANLARYQTRWDDGEGGGLGPGIQSRAAVAVEWVLGKVRGTYGSGSDVPVKLSSPGAHRYAWAAKLESERNAAMMTVMLAHLSEGDPELQARVDAAVAEVDGAIPDEG